MYEPRGKPAAWSLAVLTFAVGGCSPTLPAPAPPEPAQAGREVEQGHLLLYPIRGAEEFLGRPVKVSDDGHWTIADARLPGCEVSVQRQDAAYRVKRRVQIESLTALSAGFSQMIGFEAGYGNANEAEIDIQNTAILSAQTRGECGDVIVDRVFVGTGRRALLTSARANAGARLSVPGAPQAGVDAHSAIADETAWQDEQAYAFTYRTSGGPGLSVNIRMEPFVSEGDDVSIQIESNQPAYIVIYYLDAEKKGAVLWPSRDEPAPQVEPGRPLILPSNAERAKGYRIQAALSQPGVAAREMLVAYAFRDRADFDRLRPSAGAMSDDGVAYAAELGTRAAPLPLDRWARSMVSYVIEPRSGSQPEAAPDGGLAE